jgi:hypothetical protein
MRRFDAVVLAMLAASVPACSSEFLGGGATGAAVGAVGTGAAYEINARRQMDQLRKDLDAGRINEQEYEIRKSQIERGSVLN